MKNYHRNQNWFIFLMYLFLIILPCSLFNLDIIIIFYLVSFGGLAILFHFTLFYLHFTSLLKCDKQQRF